MFLLSSTTIDPLEHRRMLDSSKAGAFAGFEGLVRDHNQNRQVIALEYQAHLALCQAEAQKLLHEARVKFDVLDCRIVHRIGKLNVGEIAVWIGVLASHRSEAFVACRYLIDELKIRFPIWKKEHYTNGYSEWIGESSHRMMSMKNE